MVLPLENISPNLFFAFYLMGGLSFFLLYGFFNDFYFRSIVYSIPESTVMNTVSSICIPGFESWLCHLHAVLSWSKYFNSSLPYLSPL